MLLKAPSLCEIICLSWSKLLQGFLKRPLCVSLKTRSVLSPWLSAKGPGHSCWHPASWVPGSSEARLWWAGHPGSPPATAGDLGFFLAHSFPCCWPFLVFLPCQNWAPGCRHRALYTRLPLKHGLPKKRKANGYLNQSLGDLALEVLHREANCTNVPFKSWLIP